MANAFKDSLNLPETQFPMRGSLSTREPERIEQWEKGKLYERILQKNADCPAFILHDGPPFTNGEIHLGHILNKSLKDFVLRYKSMQGFRAPYRVGWDCHGLPIEHAVSKERQAEGKEFEAIEIREACAAFSERYIGIQESQFRRLGILTDWKQPYRTKDAAYEAQILRTFATFVEKGLVYRSKKPVYWSIPCATALAEAEIEYKPHKSISVWVAFAIKDASQLPFPDVKDPAHIVIWTTTPWTLPANLAVAVHPRLEYVALQHQGKIFIVADARQEAFCKACGYDDVQILGRFKGEVLEGVQTQHPFIERSSGIVLADYVTTESGTGCVHIAPGHGMEDYHTGLQYGLEVYCPLDDEGCYADDGQVPANLVGLSVLDEAKKPSPANRAVLQLLSERGALLHKETLEHSYPHCWRSKTPVVFRAMDQWFIALGDELRQQASKAIDSVTWLPHWGKARIQGAVENRPDWCISRQRSWGVPLPVFFDEDKEPYLDAKVICGIADKVAKAGTNIWFEQDAATLLEGIELPKEWQDKKLHLGSDTLDVWIDSGVSHRAVLQQDESLDWPADLYLEGSDQHRGWFQSSLWTALVADGQPPYRTVLTHGFVVNEDGSKLSKQDGARSATHYLNTLGADLLRLLIASEDYRGDIPFSDKILKQISGTYRLFRNTFRFQLGNLYDFDADRDAIALDKMLDLDQWALHKTARLVEKVTAAYEDYAFHKVYQLCNRFCAVTLSAIYHDILKDRLYTFGKDSIERRSGQTAIHKIRDVLLRLMAPILIFTTDEAYAYGRTDKDFCDSSIHLQSFPKVEDSWIQPALAEAMEHLFLVRDRVNECLEGLRKDKTIGQSLDARITISGNPKDQVFTTLQDHSSSLAELFIVSEVILQEAEGDWQVKAEKSTSKRCPRCWRWSHQLVASPLGEVCDRCSEAVG